MEYRFLANCELNEVINPSSFVKGDKACLADLENAIMERLQSVQKDFLLIGILLKEIRDRGLFGLVSYTDDKGITKACDNVNTYGMLRFGLSKTVVSNSISIVERMMECNSGVYNLYPGLQSFGYSALSELVPLTKGIDMPDENYGYLPEWVSEEVQPSMTVAEIRSIKKRHRKVNVHPSVEVPKEIEQIDDEVYKPEDVSAWHIFKNDEERKLLLKNCRQWQVLSRNTFLNLTYYICPLHPFDSSKDKKVSIIAIENKSDSEYVIKYSDGYLYRFYAYYEGKSFEFDRLSDCVWVRKIRIENLMCSSALWEKIIKSKSDEVGTIR